MKTGKFNILLDAFHGSSGKGKMVTYLAQKHGVKHLGSTNMPNAGHTTIINGVKFISKILPTASILNRFSSALDYRIYIGPTAAFYIDQLLKEINECKLDPMQLYIHPRAGVITEEHKNTEINDPSGPRTVASTMQGSGAFLADKILRRPTLKLARDYEELRRFVVREADAPDSTPFHTIINSVMGTKNESMLHEVSQGLGLDINHGSHFPNCTSRSTNSLQAISDMGVRLEHVGDIYLNVHTTPIRVGNLHGQDGEQLGYSGDFYYDAPETSWKDVGLKAGMPPEVIDELYNQQLTTVTKRLRRVFEFSWVGLDRAVEVSSATKLILNFAQYIDWGIDGLRGEGHMALGAIPHKVREFVDKIEERTNLPVVLIGTGADNKDIIDLEDVHK